MIEYENADVQVELANVIERFGCPSILLADDSLTQQFVIKAVLQNVGLSLDCVDDGKKAIELIQQKKYDIVLMDIQMPILDGISATQIIRQQFPSETLTIIALTGDTELDIDSADVKSLFNSFLHKPVDSHDLINAIISSWMPHADSSTINHQQTANVSDDQQLVQSIAQLAKHSSFDLRGGVYEWVGEAAYLRVLNAFVRVYKPYVMTLESNQAQVMTLSEQHRFFHKLKSAAANIGAIGLIKAIDDFEQKGESSIDDINHQLILVIKQLSPLYISKVI
ncbi:response regulator [Shewanella ulleungensis]|uniref:response regulator n=1 Tax=Shewanella ulleungensis TaxID=2282699 RepID=UPI003D7A1C8E